MLDRGGRGYDRASECECAAVSVIVVGAQPASLAWYNVTYPITWACTTETWFYIQQNIRQNSSTLCTQTISYHSICTDIGLTLWILKCPKHTRNIYRTWLDELLLSERQYLDESCQRWSKVKNRHSGMIDCGIVQLKLLHLNYYNLLMALEFCLRLFCDGWLFIFGCNIYHTSKLNDACI